MFSFQNVSHLKLALLIFRKKQYIMAYMPLNSKDLKKYPTPTLYLAVRV